MQAVTIVQHEQYDRSPLWRMCFVIGVTGLIVLCFIAPLWIHDGYGGSINSRNNRLNAIVLLLIVGAYLYAAVWKNIAVTLTIDSTGVLYRNGQKRFSLQDYKSYWLHAHGSQDQYYTLFVLDEEGYTDKTLYFSDSQQAIHDCVMEVEKFLKPAEKINMHWYEKLQRMLKL